MRDILKKHDLKKKQTKVATLDEQQLRKKLEKKYM